MGMAVTVPVLDAVLTLRVLIDIPCESLAFVSRGLCPLCLRQRLVPCRGHVRGAVSRQPGHSCRGCRCLRYTLRQLGDIFGHHRAYVRFVDCLLGPSRQTFGQLSGMGGFTPGAK
jgi:hypothetical protein